MSQSGVSVAPDCITAFNDLKLHKKTKWIIYKINDTGTEIVIDEQSTDPNYDTFREKLMNAKSKDKRGNEGKGARYAVYDIDYEAANGEGQRNKITFFSWVPDDSVLFARMLYSSSKEALKRSLNGIAAEIQANDQDDIEHAAVLSKVSKR